MSYLSKRLCACLQYLMSKKSNRIGKIPAFIKKLKEILEDKALSDTIQWLPEGNGFQILSSSSFTDKVLPLYFKHKNMASFVRQLNMYGFNRPKDSEQNIYIHPRFQRGNLNSMKLIKRKVGHHRDSSDEENSMGETDNNRTSQGKSQTDVVNQHTKLLAENQQLRKQNEELRNKLEVFEEMMVKIRHYTVEMQKYIHTSPEQTENQKTEKQATAFNSSSSDSSNSLNVSSNRKGFSLCSSSSCPPHFQSSYQILLQEASPGKN